MRLPLVKRLVISFCNLFFPPLAVALLTGFTSPDTMLNACLFLLAVIPSHFHAWFISLTYFRRKRKVRKGKWPGKPHKPGIWSEKVLTGGAGWAEAERLHNGSKRKSNRPVTVDYDGGELSRTSSGRSRQSGRRQRRSQIYSGHGDSGYVSRTQTPMRENSMHRVPSASSSRMRAGGTYEQTRGW